MTIQADIRKLRQKEMWSLPTEEPTPTFPMQDSIDLSSLTKSADPMQELNNIYTPETVDRDRFRNLLDAAPERKAPGLARSILAAGMSVNAKDPIETAEKVQYAPFYREMSDWKEKSDPFYKGASLENTANANERQLAGNILNNRTALERIAETERHNRETAENTRQRTESNERIARQKMENEQAKREGYEFKVVGNILYATSRDGSSYEAGRASDYSPLELARLRHTNTMAEIGKRTEGAVEVKGTMPGANPLNARGQGAPGKAEEAKRDAILQRAYDNPATRKFVAPPATANGIYQLVPPKKPFMGGIDPADQKAYDDLYKEIHGSGLSPSTAVVTPPAPTKTSPIAPSGPPKPGPTIMDRNKAMEEGRGKVESSSPLLRPSTTGNLGTAAERNAAGQKNMALRSKATKFLQENGLPVTDANIDHAIKTGRVQ